MREATPKAAVAARWAARILSAMILAFWGFFLAADLFGAAARGSRPLGTADTLILTTIVTSLAGLAAAWRWEGFGAAVALAAFVACATLNWRVAIFPGILIPVAASLFLASWWARRRKRSVSV